MTKLMLAAFALVAVVAVGRADAQVLKYVDAQGVTHYVQSVDQIPEQNRAKAVTPKLPEAAVAGHHSGSTRALADATAKRATADKTRGPKTEKPEVDAQTLGNQRLKAAYDARQAVERLARARLSMENAGGLFSCAHDVAWGSDSERLVSRREAAAAAQDVHRCEQDKEAERRSAEHELRAAEAEYQRAMKLVR